MLSSYDSLLSVLYARVSARYIAHSTWPAYASVSFLLAVFLRFGVGILHSIEKATQLVHGTPKLAASHRT